MKGNILVTGATGFVGAALVQHFSSCKKQGVVISTRGGHKKEWPSGVNQIQGGDLLPSTDWSGFLKGITVVVHCAARVHVMKETAFDPLAEFRLVNVRGTLNLARQASIAGVKRFIFVSSVKVNGENSLQGQPFTEEDAPAPVDAFGISKMEAEQGLRELSLNSGMEVVIIRSPLVYGRNAPGNFGALIRWAARGLPLPFRAVNCNSRSYVCLENLVDLIDLCLHHPNAANKTFMVSDGNDLSTAALIKKIGDVLNRPINLIYVPVGLLSFCAVLFGKRMVAQSLLGNLQVDISHTCQTLDWSPPIDVDEGLLRAVEGLVK